MKLLENYIFAKLVKDYNDAIGDRRTPLHWVLDSLIFYAHSIGEISTLEFQLITDETFTAYLRDEKIDMELLKLKVKEVE